MLQQLLYPWSLQLTLTAPLVWKAKLLVPNKGRGDWPVFQASIHLTGYLKTSGLRGVSSFRGAGVSRHATSTSSSAISRFRLICSEKKKRSPHDHHPPWSSNPSNIPNKKNKKSYPIPDAPWDERYIYLYIKTINLSHSWIGKYTVRPMENSMGIPSFLGGFWYSLYRWAKNHQPLKQPNKIFHSLMMGMESFRLARLWDFFLCDIRMGMFVRFRPPPQSDLGPKKCGPNWIKFLPQQKSGRWKNKKKNEKKLPTLAVHIYIVYYI